MKAIWLLRTKWFIIFMFCLAIFLIGGMSHAEGGGYPMKVEIIDKEQARYDNPENAFGAMVSSLIKKDLEWYYETLTEESAAQDKREYQKAGIDPQKKFDLFKSTEAIFIIDKLPYKNGILLICKSYEQNGTIIIGPSTLMKEDGKWKRTDEFAADVELYEYMDYFPVLFDGKGQRPADVNTFLSYANPLQMKTELASGTAKFSLHIFYGVTIDPATFKAELNRHDISSQFNPKPVGDQVVELTLQKGRNVLLLSIEGKRKDGMAVKDKDRLVFIVP